MLKQIIINLMKPYAHCIVLQKELKPYIKTPWLENKLSQKRR